jgi:hypothetical protein
MTAPVQAAYRLEVGDVQLRLDPRSEGAEGVEGFSAAHWPSRRNWQSRALTSFSTDIAKIVKAILFRICFSSTLPNI